MMVFVGIMLIAFAVNLGFSGPRLGELFSGFVPTKGAFGDLSVLGLIGTTFVTTAAFYQSYLVRQKGWGSDDLNAGMIDVRVGASIMALITLMLMFTPATMFHPAYQHQQIVTFPEVGHPFLDATSQKEADAQVDAMDSENLSVLALDLPGESKEYKELHSELRDSWYVVPKSEIDLANSGLPADRQATFAKRGFTDLTEVGFALKPLFGGFGPPLFFLGVFAAAYSSFLVNSMIGGFLLADGFFLNATSNDRLARRFTAAILVIGWLVLATPVLGYGADSSENIEEHLQEIWRLAEDESFNLMVVSATKTAQSLEEAPAVMTVITQQELKRWGYFGYLSVA